MKIFATDLQIINYLRHTEIEDIHQEVTKENCIVVDITRNHIQFNL